MLEVFSQQQEKLTKQHKVHLREPLPMYWFGASESGLHGLPNFLSPLDQKYNFIG